jgi:hypothetical protein
MAFNRRATTVYDRNNLSIISVNNITPVTNKSIVRYDPAHFRYIFDKLLNPVTPLPNMTADQLSQLRDGTAMTDSINFAMTWAMRTDSEVFHNVKSSSIDILRGMFIIPIHFTSAATILLNMSVEKYFGPSASGFELPDSLSSTASGAKIVPRLRGEDWTVWSYIAVSTAMLLYSMILFGLVLLGKDQLLETSAFGDIDLTQRAAAGSSDGAATLPGFLKARKVQEGNSKSITTALKGTKLLLGRGEHDGQAGIMIEVRT